MSGRFRQNLVASFITLSCATAIAAPPATPPPLPGTRPAATRPVAPPKPGRAPKKQTGATMAGWAVQPDALDKLPAYKRDLRLTLPVKHALTTVVPTRPGSNFVLLGDTSHAEQTWYVVNLSTGGAVPPYKTALRMEDHALSPDGLHLAGKVRKDGAEPAAVKVLAFKQNKLLHTIPAAKADWAPDVLGFADADTLLYADRTDDNAFKLVCFSLKAGKAVKEILGFPGSVSPYQTAISANGKYLAAVEGERLYVFDVAQGELMGEVPVSGEKDKRIDGSLKGVCFSPDGQEIALLYEWFANQDRYRVVSIDVETGRPAINQGVGDVKETQAKPIFECLPDNSGYRVGRAIVDGESVRRVYDTADIGVEDNLPLLRMLDPGTLLACSPTRSGRVTLLAAKLPRADIDKAYAAVRGGGKSVDANLPPLTLASRDGAKLASLAAPDAWAYKPDLVPAYKRLGGKGVPLKERPASNRDRTLVEVEQIVFTGAPAHQAFITYETRDASRGFNQTPEVTDTVVERVNLAANATLPALKPPAGSRAIDAAADAKHVLFQLGDRLDLYAVGPTAAAKPLTHVAGWRPYEALQEGLRETHWASILAPDRVLTVSKQGDVVLWSIPDCRAVWTLKADNFFHHYPGLSPNRKHLAIATAAGVVILDTATGDAVARLPEAGGLTGPIAFHPDGSKLAIAGRNVFAWDLATGKRTADFAAPGPNRYTSGGQLRWCGPDHLVADDAVLLDLTRMIAAWRFVPPHAAPNVKGQADDRFWTCTTTGGGDLVAQALPHPELVDLLRTVDARSALAVYPGAKVTLECHHGDEAQQKATLALMAQRAKEAGLVVAPDQPLKLVASSEQKSREETFGRGAFGRQDQQTVSIPMLECRLALTLEGQTVWEHTSRDGGRGGTFVMLRQGENLQEHINKQNQNLGQNFFKTLPPLPRNVAKPSPTGEVGYGASKITAAGLVPINAAR